MNEFAWIDYYMELADHLLPYQQNRQPLLQLLFEAFQSIDMRFPKMESDGDPTDIDPFTLFGLFSKSLTDAHRTEIIKAIGERLGVKAPAPDSFPGIPLLFSGAIFFPFKEERGEQDVDDLWRLFAIALKLSAENTPDNQEIFIECMNRVLEMRGIRWNITLGLYWIRPLFFINLDSKNQKLLTDPTQIPEESAAQFSELLKAYSGEKYLRICEAARTLVQEEGLPFNSLPSLSAYAFTLGKDSSEETNVLSDSKADTIRYWLYAPGEGGSMWDIFYQSGIMAIGWPELGDLRCYDSKAAMKAALRNAHHTDSAYTMAGLATWQFVHDVKPGDKIVVKKGKSVILGYGVVQSDYQYDTEQSNEYPNIRQVQWTHHVEWDSPVRVTLKTLTDLTPYTEDVEKIKALFEPETESEIEQPEHHYERYTKQDFLHDVFMSETDYQTLVNNLLRKKNIILQGAPGVGKTYIAKRLAYAMIGEKNPERVTMIQFHQNYAYEDFIEGFRPAGNGFELKKGVFYQFCKKAEPDDDNPYFFIIDEINRGNLSKIFGELFMLIEKDKRDIEMPLLYSEELFRVPKNVYILGMMNTADRSLAILDYALRRRFAFIDIKPGFDSDGFRHLQAALNSSALNALITRVKELNTLIAGDPALGDGFCIGHSFFASLTAEDIARGELQHIVNYELLPLLREYWFDEPDKIAEWSSKLRSAVT